MRRRLFLFIAMLLAIQLHATTWNVGPTRSFAYCSQVAPLVQHGDTVEIDFATYINDPQVIWNKNNLYIAGIGGRPRLEAGSIIASDMSNGKGIFVISGSNVHVHNIEFANAVVQDNNGAGIRQEGANLHVSNCRFVANEMGILAGNIPDCKTTVEYCEFVNGGSTLNPGYQHNIYINHIDTLLFRYNFTYDAIAEGHELKSRATYNFILYNRIANQSSEDSRTIDLPNGGTSVIVGNIIEQGPTSANSNLLGYGLEGLTNNAPHKLYCVNNTFVNKKATGSFIQVANGTETLLVKNNTFAGAKTGGLFIGTATVLDSSNNAINNALDVFGFEDPLNHDYHLSSTSVLIDAGTLISTEVLGYALQPYLSYVDTCLYESRSSNGPPDIGAYEYSLPLATTDYVQPAFSIYPNPVTSTITIDMPVDQYKDVSVRISTVAGDVVMYRSLYSKTNTIDVSDLSVGMYVATIVADTDVLVRKLLKM
ncbi:MAG TPA: T9SS type A sorting domain-containing protein [Saprospiraceae bacterium]|nr:T9SS type A sorting domain-containing protein [Saprospiraceae bacterium]